MHPRFAIRLIIELVERLLARSSETIFAAALELLAPTPVWLSSFELRLLAL